ncbi:hypothetical protein LCGC14_2301160, partial [marine sediment metagenome]
LIAERVMSVSLAVEDYGSKKLLDRLRKEGR